MTEPIPVWVAPSARDLTRDYMVEQLALRRRPTLHRGVPAFPRSGRPGSTPSRSSTAQPTYGVFADAQLLQIRCYDTDRKTLGATMRLVKALWKVMPAWRFTERNEQGEPLAVQDVEHAGGPSYDEDPDIDGLYYGQVIAWVTVMTELI